ncbi:stage III sporulation protein AF [Candidatus Arthromitus sp. SFB-turkey]|uniref:stage III sporulation protein AF n=1 Tax=Candidatus Arthromitus sp. SFB-turkey TaxID=1840217 RepID=UPI0007F54753|nr:stage III sporulation protein AF [Candidatus Arthromitus sp. SFB-turkey]OAT86903.1 stage III sporulation protein AF [Candidatus Arthromitus sp. SFB-turkey]
MEILKDWISDICVSILFMTAVELVLPENSIKKYSKFVLGLIFIVVVINPIIGFIKQDSNLYKDITLNEDYVNKFDSYLENNLDEYSERIKKTTINSFEENLSRNCENLLKNNFKKNNFNVDVSVSYEDENFKIEELIVKVEELGIKNVETVEKVVIGSVNNYDGVSKESSKVKEIKKFLSNELNISENIIKVY